MYTKGKIDFTKIRQLPSLPSTSYELKEIAKILNADTAKSLFLRERANENNVKDTKLANAKIIIFATHGLISAETGKLSTINEPALVLTPPDKATMKNNGLLTSSEISGLKLNADFVILSACNTAVTETTEPEGLSLLTNSFFYAGARSLLVSHWPVESKSATQLTTTLFKRLKTNKSLNLSNAFHQSMLELAANDNTAHPFYWAPFSIVGDGR